MLDVMYAKRPDVILVLQKSLVLNVGAKAKYVEDEKWDLHLLLR